MPLEKNQNRDSLENRLTDVSRDVQHVKDDVTKIKLLTDKIDTMINKLSDVSINISQLIAVHEQRFAYQEKAIENLITTINFAKDELSRKDDTIFHEIDDLENKIDGKRDNLARNLEAKIDSLKKDITTQHEKINLKLAFLEKFMWVATGGAAVVGFIIATVVKLIKF